MKEALAEARREPLARMLVHPTRELAVVQVSIVPGKGAERINAERDFTTAAKAVLERHAGPGMRLTLTGAPAVRATLAQMIEEDMGRLLPLALLVILGLVTLAYRDAWAVVATAGTLVAAWVWMMGAMGWLQVPLGILTSFSPIVVLVVSLTDTVHVLSDLEERRRSGTEYRQALIETMAAAAGPCLATELVIAAGFVSMGLIGLTAVFEFGLATALGVVLAWVANMLMLPWMLLLRPRKPAMSAGPQPAEERTRPLDSVLRWVERQTVEHPRRVLAVAGVVALLSVGSLTRLQREFRVFDDLRADSPLAAELSYAQEALGGLVPLAVFLEPEGSAAHSVLEPEAMAFQEQGGRLPGGHPRAPAGGEPAADAGAGERGALGRSACWWRPRRPTPRRWGSWRATSRWTRCSRRTGGPRAWWRCCPTSASARMQELVEAAQAFVKKEVPPGYRASVTGNVAMTAHVTGMLTRGLLRASRRRSG